ncbi:MAG: hypothetical protein K9L73_01150, partial [Spirochaetia bacterium]|nr:hypothetical protein [Spirochaetia bacterium]
MKKLGLMLLALILCASILPIWGSGQTEGAAGASEKGMVIYNSMNGDPEPRRVDEKLVADFAAANGDIEVVHSIIAHEDFKTAIRA